MSQGQTGATPMADFEGMSRDPIAGSGVERVNDGLTSRPLVSDPRPAARTETAAMAARLADPRAIWNLPTQPDATPPADRSGHAWSAGPTIMPPVRTVSGAPEDLGRYPAPELGTDPYSGPRVAPAAGEPAPDYRSKITKLFRWGKS